MSAIQVEFFNKIRESIPDYENLAQSIADALDISPNEAYKKIKGLSQLNISQIEILSDHFKVPFYYAGSGESNVSFTYSKIEDLGMYLSSLHQDLSIFNQAKQKNITVITDDIPVFYLFKYPELTAFKLLFWQSSISDSPPIFTLKSVDQSLVQRAQSLHDLYLQIPTIEIWGKNSVNYTIEQIKYAWEAGWIADKAFISTVISQLQACFKDISVYAVSGKKSIDENHKFEWYCCDVIGSMSYLADINGKLLCYNRFSSFNVLKTDDVSYCSLMSSWTASLINKSICFSRQSEKYRNRYLSSGIERCLNLLEEVES